MATDRELTNRLMLRARDAMDRDYRNELDVPALARNSYVSQKHFIRTFKATLRPLGLPHRPALLGGFRRATIGS